MTEQQQQADDLMTFTTRNVMQLKTIFETIHSVLQEVNLDFGPSGTEGAGIYVRALTHDQVIMVDAFFPEKDLAEKGSYRCRRACCAGLNLEVLCRLLKPMRHDDTLTLGIRDGSDYMRMTTLSADGRWQGDFQIPLLDLDATEPSLDIQVIGSTITMCADEFRSMMQKIACTGLSVVLIRIRDGQFTVASDDGTAAHGSYNVAYRTVAGPAAPRATRAYSRFDYRKLLQLTKVSEICPDVCIHLGTGHAIILDYCVVSMGTVRFAMAAKIADTPEDEDAERHERSLGTVEAISYKRPMAACKRPREEEQEEEEEEEGPPLL